MCGLLNIDEFKGKLDETMKLFNPNKYQLYILGDMNIDFFKCNSNPPTEAYLDMLYSNNLLPIITKPTRLTYHAATLIDDIYTNSTSKIVSGIVMVDISDHLPVVCVTNIPVKKHNPISIIEITAILMKNLTHRISMQSAGMLSIVMICMRQLLK